jgi:MFS family permease
MASTTETTAQQGPQSYFARTFTPFRHRDFRLMWAGAFTSTCGTWMQQVALGWLVHELTDSSFYLGLMAFLADLPIILFSLVGGVIADRADRRKLLLGSQYTQMLSALILTALVWQDVVNIWHILALVFISGVGQSFGGPAYSALIPGLVKKEEVPNAIALNSIQFNLAQMVGPMISAPVMAFGGATLAFGLNGLSFFAVVFSLYMIRATFIPKKTGESVLEGLKQGFSYVKSRGALWQLSVLGFISTFCAIPIRTLLPVFAKDVFHLTEQGFSYMVAVSGAGAVLGAIIYAGLPHDRRQVGLTLKVQAALAVLLGVFALSTSIVVSFIVLFLTGMSIMILFASITSLVQLGTTEEMRGRTMSIFMLAFRGGMPLGGLVIGTLAEQFTPQHALFGAGIVLGLSAIMVQLFGTGIKRL